jgi:putative membrane protein
MAEAPPGLLGRGHADAVLRASMVSKYAVSSLPLPIALVAGATLALLEFLVLAFGPAPLSMERSAVAAFGGVMVPAWVSAAAAFNFYRQIGATITVRRCVSLALTDMVVVFVFTLVGSILPSGTGDLWQWAILTGVAFAASVNMLVLAATADPHIERSFVPALVMPGTTLAVFYYLHALSPTQLFLGLAFVAVFQSMATLWVAIVIAPFWRNFKENGLVLLHSLLDAWAGWSKGNRPDGVALGTLQMEGFFTRNGRVRTVRFHALLFDPEGGRKILWFAPELHPGPYADLGGSDLPAKAARALGAMAQEVACFHGASTHDENPAGRDQLARVFEAVPPAVLGVKAAAKATPSVQLTSGPLTVTAQRMGGTLVVAQSRAPMSSDDIDLAVGRQVEAALEQAGFADALLLDGHNSVAQDLGRTEAGTAEAKALVDLALKAAAQVHELKRAALHIGFARLLLSDEGRREFAVGVQGIAATVVGAGEHRTAYVLIDGNNLKAGLRAEVIRALGPLVNHAEVFTTDNHAVNTTMGADNEVGSKTDNVPLLKEIVRACEAALVDLKPATVREATHAVDNVTVFGSGLTVKISTTINAAVSVMIPAYVATSAAALFACALLARLLT